MDPRAGTSAVVPPDSGMLGSEEPFADPGGDDHCSGYLLRLGLPRPLWTGAAEKLGKRESVMPPSRGTPHRRYFVSV